MSVSRIKPLLLVALLAGLLIPMAFAHAEKTGREASFMPEPDPNAPVALTPEVAPATPAPAVATPTPVNLGLPVQTEPLTDINPESIGLMATSEGGLGAGMWKGTPHGLVDPILPALNLPTSSPTLNNLAARFLLTTANAPAGAASGNQTLTAMRVEKLTNLGNAADAWKLAMLAKPDQVDEITLRLAAEAGLVSPAATDICNHLPDIMKIHTGVEWQKLLLVCQFRANDAKAAQISLDLLHAQNVKDDALDALAEKNIIGGSKQLPRQLTPLKPLTLALLRIVDQPLRDELYAHPDAALIPELLKTKAADDHARLALAERAASRGLIDATMLADVYRSANFAPDTLASAATSKESGPILRALIYQATLQEKIPQNKITAAMRLLQSGDATVMNGAILQLLASMIADIPASADFNASSDIPLLINLLAGKPDLALAWLKVARVAAIGMPGVATGLQNSWPLTVFAGVESDKDYAKDLGNWLDGALKSADPKADPRALRKNAAAVLLLLEADGFAVQDDDWARVTDAPEFEKRVTPSAFLVERLHAAGTLNHRGEAVLDALMAADANGDTGLATILEIIRSLRLVGLTADAANLAKETAAGFVVVQAKQP